MQYIVHIIKLLLSELGILILIGLFISEEYFDESLVLLIIPILYFIKDFPKSSNINKEEWNNSSFDKIYIIKDTRTGYVKIGFTSNNPMSRLSSLQTGNPSKLKLFKIYKGYSSDEGVLHSMFNKKRLRKNGEWFNLNYFDFIKIEKYFKTRNYYPTG